MRLPPRTVPAGAHRLPRHAARYDEYLHETSRALAQARLHPANPQREERHAERRARTHHHHTRRSTEHKIALPFLPPKAAGAPRFTAVLDMDETLLHSVFGVRMAGADCVYVEDKEDAEWFSAVLRSGLRQFLKELSSFAEIVVFTAGTQGYAEPLLKKVDPEGFISHILTRRHTHIGKMCVAPLVSLVLCLTRSLSLVFSLSLSPPLRWHGDGERKLFLKDLVNLGRDLASVVIVDNSPLAVLLQPENAITVPSFVGTLATEPGEGLLLGIVLPVLRVLSRQNDVRLLIRSMALEHSIFEFLTPDARRFRRATLAARL